MKEALEIKLASATCQIQHKPWLWEGNHNTKRAKQISNTENKTLYSIILC